MEMEPSWDLEYRPRNVPSSPTSSMPPAMMIGATRFVLNFISS